MYARVIAEPYDQWKAWYDKQADDIKAAEEAAAQGRKELEQDEGSASVPDDSGGSSSADGSE